MNPNASTSRCKWSKCNKYKSGLPETSERKCDLSLCCQWETSLQCNDIGGQKVKDWRRMFCIHTNQKLEQLHQRGRLYSRNRTVQKRVLIQGLQNSLAWDVAQWYRICLAYLRPWFDSQHCPLPHQKRENFKIYIMTNGTVHQENVAILNMCALTWNKH